MMKKTGSIIFYILAILLIITGIYIRIDLYLAKIPLWWDEINVSFSILNQKPFDVFSHIEANQKIPPLFLFFSYLATIIGGGVNTLTQRFLPLLSGIFSLFLVFFVGLKLFKTKIPVLLCLFFVVFYQKIIYYSCEFKPYSSDVLIFLAIILLYEKIDFNKISFKKSILYGLATFSLCITSFPALFSLSALLISKIIENKKIFPKTILPFTGIVCAGLYARELFKDIIMNEIQEPEWQDGLLSFSLKSFNDFFRSLFEFINIDYKAGIFFIFAGITIFIVQKNKHALYMLLCILIAVVASFLKIYPIFGRLMLYMYPALIFFTVKPFDISYAGNNKVANSLKFIIFILLSCILYKNVHISNVFDKNYISDMIHYNERIEEEYIIKNFFNEYKQGEKVYVTQRMYDYLSFYDKTLYKNIQIPFYLATFTATCDNYPEKFIEEFGEIIPPKPSWVILDNVRCIDKNKLDELIIKNIPTMQKYAEQDDVLIYKETKTTQKDSF